MLDAMEVMPMLVLLLVLWVTVAVLWHRIQALSARVLVLEGGGESTKRSPWSIPAEVVARIAGPSVSMPVIERGIALRPVREARPEPKPEPEPALAPEVVAETVAEPVSPAGDDGRRQLGFEDVFGRRLPIWAGGATLAVAGFLVVRYSIEAGLLSPIVRVMLGLIFGTALIGGAEAALRRAAAVGDDRVRQALAGAGVATLYGSILAAANLYALIGPATAFVGLAAVTVLAGGLSLRFGAPSAVLGLIGGLAAPALVGASQPNVPLLAAYLALAIGGLAALGRQQRWWWLGAAALAGGFGWGTLLILGGALDLADTLSVGIYTVVLGVALPLVAGERGGTMRAAATLAGCAQLAALVAVGGFAALHWALFGLIAAALTWLSRREPLLADAPILALGVAILLMLAWPAPGAVALAAVMAGAVAIFGLPTALRVWRDDARAIDAPMLAILGLAVGLVPMMQHHEGGLSALIGAAGLAIVATRGWRIATRGDDARFATLTLPAALLLVVAGLWTLPAWLWAPMAAMVALGLHHIARVGTDWRVEKGGWVFAAAAGVMLVAGEGIGRLAGDGLPGGATALLGWAVPTASFAAIACDRRTAAVPARVFQAAAALIGYGAAAQVVPATWLPLVPAAMLIALAATRRAAVMPAASVAAAACVAWAARPLAAWTSRAMVAASGMLVEVGAWPSLADAVLRVAIPAGALLAAAAALPIDARHRRAVAIAGGVGTLVALHLGVVHLFAIDTPERFAAVGAAQRFAWELLLAGLATVAWRRGYRDVAIALGGAAFAHLAWFTGLVANPLAVAQTPGPWLALAYALGGALLWAMPRALQAWRTVRDRIAMALVVVAAFTLLRQVAHDPMPLAAGTAGGEQIARSLLALALAGGFLWVGIRRSLREWRLASLGLMLVAVAKVFLHDAAGLDGLARIASFAALGFSLIGVGWLYSRYLPAQGAASADRS